MNKHFKVVSTQDSKYILHIQLHHDMQAKILCVTPDTITTRKVDNTISEEFSADSAPDALMRIAEILYKFEKRDICGLCLKRIGQNPNYQSLLTENLESIFKTIR